MKKELSLLTSVKNKWSEKMKKKNLWLMLFSLMAMPILSACTDNDRETSAACSGDEQDKNEEIKMEGGSAEGMMDSNSMDEEHMDSMMNGASMDNEHMDLDEIVSLTDSTAENELIIPTVLKSNSEEKT